MMSAGLNNREVLPESKETEQIFNVIKAYLRN
jgi:hypothetical protein